MNLLQDLVQMKVLFESRVEINLIRAAGLISWRQAVGYWDITMSAPERGVSRYFP